MVFFFFLGADVCSGDETWLLIFFFLFGTVLVSFNGSSIEHAEACEEKRAQGALTKEAGGGGLAGPDGIDGATSGKSMELISVSSLFLSLSLSVSLLALLPVRFFLASSSRFRVFHPLLLGNPA